MQQFPRTEVAGISLPRILIGTNWVLGYSHTSTAADNMIRSSYATADAVSRLIEAYLVYGIDAMMAPFAGNDVLLAGIELAQERSGRQLTLIDTPIIDVTDSKAGRQNALDKIKKGRAAGASFCLIHHSSAEKLVSKLDQRLDRLPDYLDMIRQNDMIPGLSAHMPELIVYSDLNEYDVETYIQPYNCLGFLMQVEVEYINKVIWQAKKPVMAIKTMAAGRVSPYVGLTFAFNTLRSCDMVTLGAFTPEEVHEDVEIALAAIEHRQPLIAGRSSPNQAAIPGHKS